MFVPGKSAKVRKEDAEYCRYCFWLREKLAYFGTLGRFEGANYQVFSFSMTKITYERQATASIMHSFSPKILQDVLALR